MSSHSRASRGEGCSRANKSCTVFFINFTKLGISKSNASKKALCVCVCV